MALTKVVYTDGTTVIYAQNLNDIQEAIIALEGGTIPLPPSASDGQFLTFDGNTNKWVATTVPSANGVNF